jgi:hypothetical protein
MTELADAVDSRSANEGPWEFESFALSPNDPPKQERLPLLLSGVIS